MPTWVIERTLARDRRPGELRSVLLVGCQELHKAASTPWLFADRASTLRNHFFGRQKAVDCGTTYTQDPGGPAAADRTCTDLWGDLAPAVRDVRDSSKACDLPHRARVRRGVREGAKVTCFTRMRSQVRNLYRPPARMVKGRWVSAHVPFFASVSRSSVASWSNTNCSSC